MILIFTKIVPWLQVMLKNNVFTARKGIIINRFQTLTYSFVFPETSTNWSENLTLKIVMFMTWKTKNARFAIKKIMDSTIFLSPMVLVLKLVKQTMQYWPSNSSITKFLELFTVNLSPTSLILPIIIFKFQMEYPAKDMK